MAEQDENSLIGYDPLAWLRDSESPEQLQTMQSVDADEISDDIPEPTNETEWVEEATILDTEVNQQTELSVEATACSQVVLEAVQNIQNVAQLHERLVKALDNSEKIEIDASAITQIDTASLQVLLVLKQTAIKLQKEVVFDFPSDKFIEAASLLGVEEMLEVDQAAAGFF